LVGGPLSDDIDTLIAELPLVLIGRMQNLRSREFARKQATTTAGRRHARNA
jgi:hypothetical protein